MDLLFHQDVIVATLASGSRGNCTYVGDERAGVLVDCGLSTRQVLGRLADLGLPDVRIDAVVVTHEHADHVGAARILDERLHRRDGRRVPFYMTPGTRIGLHERCQPVRIERIEAGVAFRAGAWTIEPFTVPHDTRDPVNYLLTKGATTVGVLTDLGRSTRLVERQLARMSIAVVEFNHDVEMLMDGAYPWSLKQRVRGGHGHLSNAQAAELVRVAASSRLEHLVLAHLSEENNLPALALEAAQAALHDAGLAGVTVSVASQQLPLGPFRARGTSSVGRRVPPRPRRKPTAAPPAAAEHRQLALF